MLLVFLGSIWVVLHLVAQPCPTLCDPIDCIAHQATLSMGILQARILGWVAMHSSRGSSKPSDQTQVSHVAGDSLLSQPLEKLKNTGVGSLSLLQGNLLTQESNWCLLHCRWILYQLSYQGSPRILEWVAYPFSSRSSQPRNQTGVSCIAGGFSIN